MVRHLSGRDHREPPRGQSAHSRAHSGSKGVFHGVARRPRDLHRVGCRRRWPCRRRVRRNTRGRPRPTRRRLRHASPHIMGRFTGRPHDRTAGRRGQPARDGALPPVRVRPGMHQSILGEAVTERTSSQFANPQFASSQFASRQFASQHDPAPRVSMFVGYSKWGAHRYVSVPSPIN